MAALSSHKPIIALGLIAAPGFATELASELADDLPAALAEQVSAEIAWEVPVVSDPLAAEATRGTAMIDAGRERMVREGWSLAVVLTDVPLRIGRRPVVADASATHGVAVVALPALGAIQLRRRARDAIARLVDGLMGESLEVGRREEERGRRRVGRRLAELARAERRIAPDDEGIDIRMVAAVLRGNLRLLAGMVHANRPWRLTARLSRALVAAIAAVVFALVTSDIWRLANALGVLNLAALTVVSLVAIVVFLVLAHGLWERPVDGIGREQAILFNLTTTVTLVIGVACLYGALFVLGLAGAGLAVARDVLAQDIGHPADLATYLRITWLASSLATAAGALGAGLESDTAVREAAYGYRSERTTERERRRHDDGGTADVRG
jgi:hypothetical protein